MSAVTKCDICGEIHSEYDRKNTFSVIKMLTIHPTTVHGPVETDFCPECTKKLLEFIDVLKTGKDYCIYIGKYDGDVLVSE